MTSPDTVTREEHEAAEAEAEARGLVQAKPTPFSIQPIAFEVAAADIALLSRECEALTIEGVDDKEGYKLVDEMRKDVKKLRCGVTNREKELKASANEYRAKVTSASKALIELIEPIEESLAAKLKAIDDEKERLKAEKANAARQKLKDRMTAIRAFDYPGCEVYVEAEVAELSDDDFSRALRYAELLKQDYDKLQEQKTAEQKAEQERLDKEKAEVAAEKERLEKTNVLATQRQQLAEQRAEALLEIGVPYRDLMPANVLIVDMPQEAFDQLLAKLREIKQAQDDATAKHKKELEDQQAKIDAENKRIADEKERQRKELHELRATALLPYAFPGMEYDSNRLSEFTDEEWSEVLATAKYAKEKYEAERAERRQREAEEKAAREEQERQRLEALKPDHEKIIAYADALDAVPKPELSDAARISGACAVTAILSDTTRRIRNIAAELLRGDRDA